MHKRIILNNPNKSNAKFSLFKSYRYISFYKWLSFLFTIAHFSIFQYFNISFSDYKLHEVSLRLELDKSCRV